MKDRFTRITFKNYKALRKYSVTLNEFNVLVGPNNAGKSTIVSAFRILSEGMRKASSRKAVHIADKNINSLGYHVPLDGLAVATENIFTDYDDSEPAVIEFTLSTGNKLSLVFPENDVCYLVCNPKGAQVSTPSEFKRAYSASVGFVPVLGPVEHNEQMYQIEAARQALLSHRASRNFRNIWYHYPDEFEEFRQLIRSTWPGMDIELPEIDSSHKKPVLHMFCPEERYPREIFWAGFGFQVWCQMLTFIVKSKKDSLLIIDEPDIYLHSDLQRQLVDLLRNSYPDVLIATHSTEIISETDPGDLLVINKKNLSARRISNPSQLQSIFGVLGSNLNPTLTQLAKSKRAVFVEGKDFQVLSALARKTGNQHLANRSDFAIIPVDGFNPTRVKNFSEGIELTLGTKILKAIIFDRDYRAPEEVASLLKAFNRYSSLSHIHERKEIENYLLDPAVIHRAVEVRAKERESRTGKAVSTPDNMTETLTKLTDKMRSRVNAQFMSKRAQFIKSADPSLDVATINERMLDEFEKLWESLPERLKMVPGRDLLSSLNEHLQEEHSISITPTLIINCMRIAEIPAEICELLQELEKFRVTSV